MTKKPRAKRTSERPAGQRLGYIRVSTVDQNQARQLHGVPLDRRFTDHCSGSTTTRPGLTALRQYAREGDTVLVHSLDRLGRNLLDLRGIVDEFVGRGIRIEFLAENLAFGGAVAPLAQLQLTLMGAFAEFERSLLLERQREGIAAAKLRGAYDRGLKLTKPQRDELRRRIAAGEHNKAKLARELGISRQSIYKYLRLDIPAEMQATA